MPYIHPDERPRFDRLLTELAKEVHCMGELNYCITRLCALQDANKYEDHNAIYGAMMCAAAEYYRRKIAVLEDEKTRINGDVY